MQPVHLRGALPLSVASRSGEPIPRPVGLLHGVKTAAGQAMFIRLAVDPNALYRNRARCLLPALQPAVRGLTSRI